MDSKEGSTGTPDGLDLIEAVAQANDASDSAATLPRLQSSPCAIHSRAYQQQHHLPMYRQQQLQQRNYSSNEPRNDLLYSTNCHGGQVRRSSSQASGNSGRRSTKSNNSGELRRQEEERIKMEREKTFKQDVLAGKAQRYFRPSLPNEMPSQDFVSSWLIHGSQPEGQSHFPDLIPDHNKSGQLCLPASSDINRGKKQTLKPIQAMNGEYAKGLRGSSIRIADTRPKYQSAVYKLVKQF
ncbi:hypothetical protein PoB_000956500 [Plakobranchus ocellatus]|uniref:Uncharacterized protein n=1 Tax=Plakobranchus ocellatus TaxID=259542 RepID=A0AAV3YIZ4_9GAST|nr:hypothetical protein PoB_000956500 [Plakobranchus ocellatus]